MKTLKWILVSTVVFLIAACHAHKKSSAVTPAVAAAPDAATNTITPTLLPTDFFIKPVVVTYTPGTDELTAIRKQYNEVTLEQLNEGYVLYAQSSCIICHTAKDIHLFEEAQWKHIIDDMAKRASISDQQKDAVYKYVLAVKATQNKGK